MVKEELSVKKPSSILEKIEESLERLTRRWKL